MNDETNINPESGAAKLIIELADSHITVKHGFVNKTLLAEGDAHDGDWDRLIDFLRNDLGLTWHHTQA